MPTFQATDRDGVIDFLAESFEKDPRLSYKFVDEDDESYDDAEGGFSCLYRSPNSPGCAFGRCITDEELKDAYGGVYEGRCAHAVIENLKDRNDTQAFLAIGDGRLFWDSLQRIHDCVARMDSVLDGDPPPLTASSIPAMLRQWRKAGYPILGSDEHVVATFVGTD